MDKLTHFTIPGIALVLTLAFGFWLSNAGKPYHGILFNIHKLIALGGVIITIIRLSPIIKTATPISLVVMCLILAALCVIALFASGALMSAGRLDYTLMLTIHRLAPVVMVMALALVVYLLGRQS